jgi:RNA polymerase sigma factor (sigma-70 family)
MEEPSMPPFDPKKRAPPGEAKDAPRTLTTTGGVQVIVRPAPPPREPPEPRREPEPVARGPRAIILPEGQTPEERRAWLDTLCREHEELVDALLARRNDVLEESRKDLRQRVLVILYEHVVKTEQVPEHMRAWLGAVIRKEVRNHKDRWRPDVQEGADAEAVPAGSEKEPERAVDLAGRRARLERCLEQLPAEQAAVIRCLELFEMTLAETAAAMGKPTSSVFDLARKAAEKLERLMNSLPDGAFRTGGKRNEGR